MKTLYKITLTLICLVTLTQSCSRKKDKFLNRNFHAVATEFNVLYNGNIALERGKETVNNAFTENFWQLLPVERMTIKDQVFLANDSKNQDFERAEEKAIKAIQKHGMNIGGKEKNPQIDEAYLLLGKARYFDQRFVPALAAFNNILNKYPTSDKINQVKIWREKSNMRLDNNEIAIKKLKELLETEDIEGQDLADASAAIASAYINIKANDSAISHLTIASENTKIKREKARYLYIKGQLYNSFNKKDSASLEFQKIIKMHRKVPRAFYINAHIQNSYLTEVTDSNKEDFEEYLEDLYENRENRPFLDKIFYRVAEYHRANKSDSLAKTYYNKSLRKTTTDNYLKSLSYETLGNMFFDENNYRVAGKYYDSTLTVMQPRTKAYRLIVRKRENLDDVIKYEDIAQRNDSILNLLTLSDAERLTYFTKYIEKLKEEEKEKAEALEKEKNRTQNSAANVVSIAPKASSDSKTVSNPRNSNLNQSKFYFYNSTTVAYGKSEFLKIWGNRKLQDNWRISNQRANNNTTVKVEQDSTLATNETLYDPETYIALIPTDQKEIDSIKTERNFAYYQLGVIYKEKFSELELSKNKFENLLDSNPEQRLILPSKYNLYKIYEALGLNAKAELMKQDIIANYPDSRYAEILKNPEAALSKDANSPEAIYESLYKKFENEDYKTLISEAEVQIKRFEGDPFVPKLEILKASAKGRLYGFEAYKEGVNYIALTYANTEEGIKAQDILKNAIPSLAKKDFTPNSEENSFHLLYTFMATENETIAEFIEELSKKLSEETTFNLTVSKDVYTEDKTFVVIHGLKSFDGSNGFAELLKTDKNNKTDVIFNKEYISISSKNYATIQRHKNLESYKNYIKSK